MQKMKPPIMASAIVLTGLVAVGYVFITSEQGAQPSDAAPPSGTTARVVCNDARSYYVSPDGAAGAPGTLDEPLDLQTALSAKSPAKACDTIWLRGGVYRGTFTTGISGVEGGPIIVRQHHGERAVIDSAPSPATSIAVNTNFVWLWGFEVTNSDPLRLSAEPVAWPGDLRRGTGVLTRGTGIKVIDMVIHDLARGIQVTDSVAPELYGNLIFNNGWDGPSASNGSGIETENQTAPQVIADNIIFNQYGHGIIAISSDTRQVNNLTIEGNFAFNNGLPGRSGFTRDVLVGGGIPPANLILTENATYGGAQTLIGYGNGCEAATIRNNYLVGSTPLLLEKCKATMENNTLFGKYPFGPLLLAYPANKFYPERPTGIVVRYRPNRYEPGRAHIAVYNWDSRTPVPLDLGQAGLAAGDRFEIYDAQNYGNPIVVDTVPAGGIVQVTTTGLKAASPVGYAPTIAHTGPEFAVFIVRKATPSTTAARSTP